MSASAQTFLLIFGLGLLLFCISGAAVAYLCRRHHDQHARVTVGGAIFFGSLYITMMTPFQIAVYFFGAKAWAPIAIIPGSVLFLMLIMTGSLLKIPVIGTHLHAFMLALERFQLQKTQKRIRRLEESKK